VTAPRRVVILFTVRPQPGVHAARADTNGPCSDRRLLGGPCHTRDDKKCDSSRAPRPSSHKPKGMHPPGGRRGTRHGMCRY
jgi:hypothetical protein